MKLLRYFVEMFIEMMTLALITLSVLLLFTTSSSDECSVRCVSFYSSTVVDSQTVGYNIRPYTTPVCRWVCNFGDLARAFIKHQIR